MDELREVTGLELKVERVRVRVKAIHVARAMGVSPSRLANIEQAAVVTTTTAARYRAALAECRTGRTPQVGY